MVLIYFSIDFHPKGIDRTDVFTTGKPLTDNQILISIEIGVIQQYICAKIGHLNSYFKFPWNFIGLVHTF